MTDSTNLAARRSREMVPAASAAMSMKDARYRRRVIFLAVVCWAAVLVAAFTSERIGGRISWHFPGGGRISLSRSGDQYVLTKSDAHGVTVKYIQSRDEIVDAELRTDDAGSFWLISRGPRPRVVDVFAASDGTYIGKPSPPTPAETFSLDSGRILERSSFFGF